jgi:hypothetical protein
LKVQWIVALGLGLSEPMATNSWTFKQEVLHVHKRNSHITVKNYTIRNYYYSHVLLPYEVKQHRPLNPLHHSIMPVNSY